ncbi:MAG: hypothetical protein E7536_05060 [Ruminococcaceae bacterium]|nr:hypothetical protein [Oscillospiraceae bacterium]
MNFKDKYKDEINKICFDSDFETETAALMGMAANQKGENNMSGKKTFKIILVATIVVAILSTSVFAFSYFLSARDVAEHFGNSDAVDSFAKKEKGEIFSVTDKGYTVSFLGQSEGKDFVDVNGIDANCSYFVISVAKEDGTPLSINDGNPLGLSVVVEGYPAWKVNSWSLGTSAQGFEENGVLYYLYECVSLEIFAEKNVYLAVYEGFAPTTEIITMSEDGTFDFADDYDGFKAMFRLPLDKEKANPEKAEEIISSVINAG